MDNGYQSSQNFMADFEPSILHLKLIKGYPDLFVVPV